MNLSEFVHEKLAKIIRLGGSETTDEHASKRTEMCMTVDNGEPCKYLGVVRPTIMFATQGCTICRCPIATKAKTLKRFSRSEGKIIPEYCPHPDGNKWSNIDQFFNNIVNQKL